MRKSGLLHLIIAVALAAAAVVWYVGYGVDSKDLQLPTEYASDVFTTWETLPEDSLAIRFSGVDVLGDEFEAVWRAGKLEGDEAGLAFGKRSRVRWRKGGEGRLMRR